jgi:thioredoxin 1
MNEATRGETQPLHAAVTDETFDREVLQAQEPVLVDFWAPWCGPCRMIGPVIEELARDFTGRAKVLKLNVDDNPSTAARYRVASIPTLLLFRNGQVVDQVVGLAPKPSLAAKIEAHLN